MNHRILILAFPDGDAADLARTLRAERFDVVVVETADDACAELAASPPFDLCLVDLDLRELRGGRGLDFARELRTAYPATRVVLSGTSFFTERQLERTDTGAAAFFAKPFDLFGAPAFMEDCIARRIHLRRLWHAEGAPRPSTSYAM